MPEWVAETTIVAALLAVVAILICGSQQSNPKPSVI